MYDVLYTDTRTIYIWHILATCLDASISSRKMVNMKVKRTGKTIDWPLSPSMISMCSVHFF